MVEQIFNPTQAEESINHHPRLAILLFETYAIIDMRQTINDIVQQCILKGRTELHRLTTVLYSLGLINILTSLFLLGITTVLILIVFRKSFKSMITTKSESASAVKLDIEPQRLGGNGTNRIKKDRPFGGM